MVVGVLEGLALVTASAKAIKSAINTANSVKDISYDLDRLFEGADKCQSKSKQGRLGKWEAFIKGKVGSVTDKLSIGTVAVQHLERIEAEQSLQEMGRLIDRRWGDGTFKEIEDQHAALVKSAKSAASELRRAKAQKLNKAFEIIGGVVLVAGSVIGMILWLQFIKK